MRRAPRAAAARALAAAHRALVCVIQEGTSAPGSAHTSLMADNAEVVRADDAADETAGAQTCHVDGGVRHREPLTHARRRAAARGRGERRRAAARGRAAGRGMSYLLPHLTSGWAVDQAILSEEARVVVLRFGHDYDPVCMQNDEVMYSIAELVKNYAVIYLVDTHEVPDFNTMYELYDPCTVMFFYRNKHIMIDLGTGNNNKINWAIHDKQEMIDIIETIYRGARKGRGLVVSPKDYSTKYRY